VIDELAADFAQRHGSFTLFFDAAQNHASPDYAPWTLILGGDETQSWGGYDAEGVIRFADEDLSE
jgi:hypothetical protein